MRAFRHDRLLLALFSAALVAIFCWITLAPEICQPLAKWSYLRGHELPNLKGRPFFDKFPSCVDADALLCSRAPLDDTCQPQSNHSDLGPRSRGNEEGWSGCWFGSDSSLTWVNQGKFCSNMTRGIERVIEKLWNVTNYQDKEGVVPSIYFVGDSSTRGLYCHLLEYTVQDNYTTSLAAGCGDEHQTPATMEGGTRHFGFTIEKTLIEQQVPALDVSWTYTYQVADLAFFRIIGDLVKFPDVMVYNTGAWEQVYYSSSSSPGEIGELRYHGMVAVVEFLEMKGFKGLFIYRNSICNVRFDSREYDLPVERYLLNRAEASFKIVVLDAFAMSAGTTKQQTYDGFHMDRTNPPRDWKPDFGTLNDAILLEIMNTALSFLTSSTSR